MHNFLTPLAYTRLIESKGYGTFASQPIKRGTIVATFGGTAANRTELSNFSDDRQRRSIQIEIDLFLVGPTKREPGDSINHSCTPNCGMRNATQLTAMHDIEVGAELTFDYAMTDTSDYDEFPCSCRSLQCRGRVTAEDWRRDDLRLRYVGFYSPYIQRLINASNVSRLLAKRDVERLMAEIDVSPVTAVLRALRIVIGRPDASWNTAISMYCKLDARYEQLCRFSTSALDVLARELNETRGTLYPGYEPPNGK